MSRTLVDGDASHAHFVVAVEALGQLEQAPALGANA